MDWLNYGNICLRCNRKEALLPPIDITNPLLLVFIYSFSPFVVRIWAVTFDRFYTQKVSIRLQRSTSRDSPKVIRYFGVDTEILRVYVACVQYKTRVLVKSTGSARKRAPGTAELCKSKALVLEEIAPIRSKLGLITLFAIVSSIGFSKESPLEST